MNATAGSHAVSRVSLSHVRNAELASVFVSRTSGASGPMAERRRLFPAGRAALGVGALLLLVSLFLPWFVVTGAQERLSAGTYTGVGSTTLLNDLAQGPWAWAAFGWLTVCVIAAFTSATMGRRVTNFGTSEIGRASC